jgi:hypothetical protein
MKCLRTVAVEILAGNTRTEASQELGTATKVFVGGPNTSIDDIDIDTLSSRRVKGILEVQLGGILAGKGRVLCKTGKTPRSVGLLENVRGVHDGIYSREKVEQWVQHKKQRYVPSTM